MKLRFIYKYKGNKIEHDKFLHCKNQMSNQNLHAIKNTKREYKHIEDMYITSRLVVLTPRYIGNCQQIRPSLILGDFFATRKYFRYWLFNYTLYGLSLFTSFQCYFTIDDFLIFENLDVFGGRNLFSVPITYLWTFPKITRTFTCDIFILWLECR